MTGMLATLIESLQEFAAAVLLGSGGILVVWLRSTYLRKGTRR